MRQCAQVDENAVSSPVCGLTDPIQKITFVVTLPAVNNSTLLQSNSLKPSVDVIECRRSINAGFTSPQPVKVGPTHHHDPQRRKHHVQSGWMPV
jgi:hypothetical protein